MKKLTALLLTLALVLTLLTACGANSSAPAATQAYKSAAADFAMEEVSAEAPMAMDGAGNALTGAGETGSTSLPESRKWIVTVDMSAMPDSKWMSPWLFVPALVLCLIPMLFDMDFVFLYLMDAVMVVLCWLGYRYLYRNKAEMVDDNSTVTAALSRIRRIQWGKMWLLCAYAMAAMNWLAYLTMYSPVAMHMPAFRAALRPRFS